MKKVLITALICLVALLTANKGFAQDTIVKKDGQVIKAKVIEIGATEIKYKYFDAQDGPMIVINRADIKSLKIKGQDDKMLEVITPEPEAPTNNNQLPDIIIKKDNEQLKVKVLEIGSTTVKYRYFDSPNGPVIVMEKRDIKTIKIKGKMDKSYDVINNEPDPMSTGNAAILDKTSAFKFNFFSPLAHHLAFSYEWMIRPGFNWETGLGIVGPGVGLSNSLVNLHPKGAFLRTGAKFLLGNSSDVEVAGERYAHPLKGRYFKIEAILFDISKDYDISSYNYSIYNYYPTTAQVHDNYVGITLDIVYGRQFIVGNSITLGWYVGVGYGFESKTTSLSSTVSNYYSDPTRYSHLYMGDTFPMILTGGFNIGYIFKTPEWINRITAPRVSNTSPSRHSLRND